MNFNKRNDHFYLSLNYLLRTITTYIKFDKKQDSTDSSPTVRCKETRLFGTFLYKLAIFIKLKNYLNVA